MQAIRQLDLCSRPGLGAIMGFALIVVTASFASADRTDEAPVPAVVEVLAERVGTRDEQGELVGSLLREELPTPPFAVIDVVSGHVRVETRDGRTVILDRSDVVLNLQDASVGELCELLTRERTRGSSPQPGGCAGGARFDRVTDPRFRDDLTTVPGAPIGDRSRVPDPDDLDSRVPDPDELD